MGQLRQLKKENLNLKQSIKEINKNNKMVDDKIEFLKHESGVIILSDNKFTSFGLVPSTNEQPNSEKKKGFNIFFLKRNNIVHFLEKKN